jgi:hypothetical protein
MIKHISLTAASICQEFCCLIDEICSVHQGTDHGEALAISAVAYSKYAIFAAATLFNGILAQNLIASNQKSTRIINQNNLTQKKDVLFMFKHMFLHEIEYQGHGAILL